MLLHLHGSDMPLTELEKPEVIAKVKEQHKKQIEN